MFLIFLFEKWLKQLIIYQNMWLTFYQLIYRLFDKQLLLLFWLQV